MGTAKLGKLGKQDIEVYKGDGVWTFSRDTPSGGKITLDKIDWQEGVDVYWLYSGYTDTQISEALTAIGTSTDTQIYLKPGTWTIANDLTLPSNIYVHLAPGAVFAVSSGKTLTLYSPENIIASPRQQIFSGAGTVAWSYSGTIELGWWGPAGDGSTDDTTAIQAALTSMVQGSILKCRAGSSYYKISSALTITDVNYLTIEGDGADFQIRQSGSGNIFTITGTSEIVNFTLCDMVLHGNDIAAIGLSFTNAKELLVERVYISNCLSHGISITGSGNINDKIIGPSRITGSASHNADSAAITASGNIIQIENIYMSEYDYGYYNNGADTILSIHNTYENIDTNYICINTGGNFTSVNDYFSPTGAPTDYLKININNPVSVYGSKGLTLALIDYSAVRAIPTENFVFQASTDGLIANGGYVVSRITTDTTQAGNDSGSGQTDLITFTLPGGAILRNGQGLRLIAAGTTAANANNKRARLYLGSDYVIDSGNLAANNKDWRLEATIYRTGAATAKSIGSGEFNGAIIVTDYRAITPTFSGNLVIKVTGNGVDANDVVAELLSVEIL